MFITFEGIEGSGKTSQAEQLAGYLQERLPVVLTWEPGGTRLGEQIREIFLADNSQSLDPVSQVLLLSAARAELVRSVIRPALSEGKVVICVRYADSTRAYQGGGEGVDVDIVEGAIALATRGLEPDLTIFLDVDVDVGLTRRSLARRDGWNRFDRLQVAFHERVRAAYLDLASRHPDRIVVVDASRPFDVVGHDIRALVTKRLEARSVSGG